MIWRWLISKFPLISLEKWSWLVTSSTWLLEFVWKRFLLGKLHIRQKITLIMSSMISFFSRTITGSGFNFYHMWKLRCQGCVCTPSSLQTVMWKELNVRKVNGIIVYRMLSMKNQRKWKISLSVVPFVGAPALP